MFIHFNDFDVGKRYDMRVFKIASLPDTLSMYLKKSSLTLRSRMETESENTGNTGAAVLSMRLNYYYKYEEKY